MKPRDIFKLTVLTMGIVGLLTKEAYSVGLSTNSEGGDYFFSSATWTNFVWLNNAVMDLGAQLHWNANEDIVCEFDKQVCKSVDIRLKSPVMISQKEVSFVVYAPKTNDLFGSQQEMDGSVNLIYQDGKIARTNTEERVPTDYIWLVDPNEKELTVEIDVLLSVAPVKRPQDVKYFRRSFRFVYRNKWIED